MRRVLLVLAAVVFGGARSRAHPATRASPPVRSASPAHPASAGSFYGVVEVAERARRSRRRRRHDGVRGHSARMLTSGLGSGAGEPEARRLRPDRRPRSGAGRRLRRRRGAHRRLRALLVACEGTGTFRPLAGASPAVGEVGQEERVAELRLETVFPEDAHEAVVAALRAAHPYEEPAFDVYGLL